MILKSLPTQTQTAFWDALLFLENESPKRLRSFAWVTPQNKGHWDPQAKHYSSCCSRNGYSPARLWEQGAHPQHLHSLLPGAQMPALNEGHPLITLQPFGKVHCFHQLLCNVKGVQATQFLLPEELQSKQVVIGGYWHNQKWN